MYTIVWFWPLSDQGFGWGCSVACGRWTRLFGDIDIYFCFLDQRCRISCILSWFSFLTRLSGFVLAFDPSEIKIGLDQSVVDSEKRKRRKNKTIDVMSRCCLWHYGPFTPFEMTTNLTLLWTSVSSASSPPVSPSHSGWVAQDTPFMKWAMSWANLFMPYANSKGTDQPAYLHSLIRAVVLGCLDSIIFLVSVYAISRL